MKTQILKNIRSLKGQAIVEFALTAPIFFLMAFGSIHMIGLTYQAHAMSKAMWDATRGGVVATSDNPLFIKKRMQNDLEKTLANAGLKNILLDNKVVKVMDTEGSLREGELQVGVHFLKMLNWVGLNSIDVKGGAFPNFEGKLPQKNADA